MNSSFVFGRRSRTPKPQAAAAAPAAAEEDVSAETSATPMEVETSEFEAAAGVVGVVGAAQEPDTEEMPLLMPPVKSRLGAVIAARSLALSDAAAVAMRRLPAWQRLGKRLFTRCQYTFYVL